MRQPEAPIGCPSAMAPPFTFTLPVSQPICRFTAIACAAKASLISIKSRSFGSHPARDRQRLDAGTGPIPMYFGSTPAEAKALMRAMGFNPSSFAFFDEARTTAAAPSLIPEALPAVTLPFLSKAGLRPFSASSVVPCRGYSSSAKTTVPLRLAISTGMISSLKRPALCAASVFCWLASANWSWSSRVTAYSFATFSAVTPMWYWLYTSQRPSMIMVSTIFASPMRKPSREPLIACGDMLIDSCPPATMMSASPCAIDCAPSMAAFRPDPGALQHLADDESAEVGSGHLRQAAAELADRSACRADDENVFHGSLLIGLLLHIATGRRLDRLVSCAAGRARCRARAAGVASEPLAPERPPAAALLARIFQPRIGIVRIGLPDPVTAALLGRGVDYAGNVPARAEHERLFFTQQRGRAIGRAPWNDVVLARRQHEHRQFHFSQIDRYAAVHQGAGLLQPVLEIGVAHVIAVHRPGQVGAVRIPEQQIERRGPAAEQIVVHDVRPDEVVGAQARKDESKVGPRQDAALADRRLTRPDARFVDEHAELPGFGEIQHRRQQGDARHRVIALCGEHRERRAKQRAADAEPERVHSIAGADLARSAQRREHALFQVVVPGEVTDFRPGVAPGQHEYRIAARDGVRDKGVLRLEVEDVVLVDAGRHDDERVRRDLRGGRRVLNQLDQLVFEHHMPRGDGKIAADLESPLVALADAALLHVAHQVCQAACQALAAAL